MNPTRFFSALAALSLLAGCAATAPGTQAPRAADVVTVSSGQYEAEFAQPNQRPGQLQATALCQARGYADARPLGGPSLLCDIRLAHDACYHWVVGQDFQCTAR